MPHTCPTCGDWVRDKTRHRCPDLVTVDNVGTTVLAHVSSARHDTEVAAASIQDMDKGCRMAYEIIEGADNGMCDFEGKEYFFSFPKRRCDLYQLGLVRDSGKRRPTPRGAPAIVWEVVS